MKPTGRGERVYDGGRGIAGWPPDLAVDKCILLNVLHKHCVGARVFIAFGIKSPG